MKITFISVFPDLTAFGLRTICSYVAKRGYETQVIFLPDAAFSKIRTLEARMSYAYPSEVETQVEELARDSDLVAFSVFSCYIRQAKQLSQRLRDLKIPVVWGGKHPSAMPEESLRFADMVCIGEGEEAFLELLDRMKEGRDFHDTLNFWFNTPEGIVKNPVRPLRGDIDAISDTSCSGSRQYVWRKDEGVIKELDVETYRRFLPADPLGGYVYHTMFSRGCPFACSYCYSFKNLYKGQKYVRHRSVDDIIRELKEVKNKYNFITHVNFCDDEFMANSIETMREFTRRFKDEIGLRLSCLGNPVNIKAEKLDLLIDAGLCLIQIGVQSVSPSGKKAFRRNISNDVILESMHLISKYKDKFIPLYDFIIDNPYETPDDIVENIRFMLQIPRPFHINLFSLAFFPGTELYNKARESGQVENCDATYVKAWLTYQKRYLNLVMQLFNYRAPGWIIRLLITRPMVFLFERKSVSRVLFFFADSLRRYRVLAMLKKFDPGKANK